MSDDVDVVEERDGYRVRLEYDDSPEKPYDDGAVPILTYDHGRVEAFNSQAEDYVHAVSEVLDRHDWDTLERFVKIFYGAVKLDREYSDGFRGYYIAFDTAAWRERVGAPEDRLKDEDYLSEVRAWAEGDVYGYIVERKVTGRKVYDGVDINDAEPFEEWLHEDSCWGFYGREWAEQAAREALKVTIEKEDE